jgi:membrane dipeptidase
MDDAAALHARTLTLDTHIDIKWPDPPDPATETNHQVDFPKMARGGMRAAVFIAYTQQGARDQQAHDAAGAKCEAMLRHIRARADGRAQRFCATAEEVEAAHRDGVLAVLSAVENGYAMGHDLSRLKLWRSLGAIYVTLTHDGHNDLADSARPKQALGDGTSLHGGLSALGREAVREMSRVGLLLDLSHVAKPAMMQATALSRTPVVVTHTCCKALVDHPRNLDDEQLDAVRAAGGVVQITAVPAFLRKQEDGKPQTAHVADIADHVEHAVRRIGLDHVGLSSDFDGGGGVHGWASAAETGGLTAELHRRGFGERELGLLWSGNFLRMMRLAQRLAG